MWEKKCMNYFFPILDLQNPCGPTYGFLTTAQTEIPRKGEEKKFRLISIRQSGKLLLGFMDDIIKAQNSAMI